MKPSRSLLLWATLAFCGVIVLGAMSWLTRGVLAAERERVEAEGRADLEERTRLALWRMDALGAAIIAGENRHPPAAYHAGAQAFPPDDPMVRLHFELRQFGKLTSPAPHANLGQLRKLLGANPLPGDEWSVLTCAAEAGESAWQAVPKDAPQSRSDNYAIRQQKGGNEIRRAQAYQSNSSEVELSQRAKVVSENITNSLLPADGSNNRITEIGTLRAVWVGGELFLLRQLVAAIPGAMERRVQGVWLDREILKDRLLSEIRDLLPAAELIQLTGATADDPLALVSFPYQLQRNESPPAASTRLNGPLIIGWAAVLLALLTTMLLVHGVMRLSDRRASFVSAVTHELRTPLTTFRLYSDMLESGAVKPEKRGEYLRVLSREADRLSHLVENVLSFSKIERGSARSAVRESTLASLLEPMRDRLEARLATAGMSLEMNTECQLRVRVDAAVVEHILFNLIDNAAKYASAGDPPKVEIRVEPAEKTLGILVSDHGPGIPASERRRIFRPFHKSAREAAESRPGVGLGLALSRRLAKSLGGGLDLVASKSGARFILRLPIAAVSKKIHSGPGAVER